MRVLVARCSIGYSGRLTTRLASGERVLIFKDDGSVCIHGPKGFKPINYMSGPTTLTEEDGLITVRRPETGETLLIEVEEVLADDAQFREELDGLFQLRRDMPAHLHRIGLVHGLDVAHAHRGWPEKRPEGRSPPGERLRTPLRQAGRRPAVAPASPRAAG